MDLAIIESQHVLIEDSPVHEEVINCNDEETTLCQKCKESHALSS